MTAWALLAIALVLVGLALILAEAFVPSGGLLTILAVLAGGGGIALAFVKSGPAYGLALLVGALLLAPVAFLYGMSRLPRTFIGRRLVLRRLEHHGWTRTAAEKDYAALLGREGVAVSNLRPAGIAEIDGRRYDVVTEGPLVTRGTRVRVLAVEGNRVVVRAVENAEQAEQEEKSAPPA